MQAIKQPRVLVNAATIGVGGGVQAARSFVEFALGQSAVEFLFVLARAVGGWGAGERDRIVYCDDSPSKPLRGHGTRALLRSLERSFAPDLVYSIGFPSYTRFTRPEVGWYVNGWEILDPGIALSVMKRSERGLRSARTMYRTAWARRARYFQTETELGKRGIVRRLSVAEDRVLVVPNSVSPEFLRGLERTAARDGRAPRRVLCIGGPFRHKNFEIVPRVAWELRHQFRLECTFVVTLPSDSGVFRQLWKAAQELDVQELIENVGVIDTERCADEYARASAVFAPSLFEMFSATYIEAMAAGVPLAVSDLPFARDICGEAALYYTPLQPAAAAATLASILTDGSCREHLVAAGSAQWRRYPSHTEKQGIVVEWLASIANNERVRAQ